jgi:hypothetical protein
VCEAGILDERLGELLLRETACPDQPRPQFLVGDGQRDALDAPSDQVDEAVLLEVADLEHARCRALREELEYPGQVEPVDGALQEHLPPAVAVLVLSISA